MTGKTDILNLIKESAAKRILFLPHAVRQMLKPDRMITTKDVRHVVLNGEVIEDYPEDARGHSCLIYGNPADRPVHVICSPKKEYLTIITAYVPNKQDWKDNYQKRIKS